VHLKPEAFRFWSAISPEFRATICARGIDDSAEKLVPVDKGEAEATLLSNNRQDGDDVKNLHQTNHGITVLTVLAGEDTGRTCRQ
jgi:hypothetical protein